MHRRCRCLGDKNLKIIAPKILSISHAKTKNIHLKYCKLILQTFILKESFYKKLDFLVRVWSFLISLLNLTFFFLNPSPNYKLKHLVKVSAIIFFCYIKGINFRGHKFSRVLIFTGINSRNHQQFRENSRKLMPAKYAKTVDSRKFAKINHRENIELSVQTSGFQQNAE